MGEIFIANICQIDNINWEPRRLCKIGYRNDPRAMYHCIKDDLIEYDDISLMNEEDFMSLDFSDKKVGYPTKIIGKGVSDKSIELILYSDFFSTAVDYLIKFAEEL